jgi:hypothetical protein
MKGKGGWAVSPVGPRWLVRRENEKEGKGGEEREHWATKGGGGNLIMWNTPIFRSTVQTISGIYIRPTQPIPYRTANDALKRPGELAGYRYP